jgi:hypothetical protein
MCPFREEKGAVNLKVSIRSTPNPPHPRFIGRPPPNRPAAWPGGLAHSRNPPPFHPFDLERPVRLPLAFRFRLVSVFGSDRLDHLRVFRHSFERGLALLGVDSEAYGVGGDKGIKDGHRPLVGAIEVRLGGP